MAQDRFRYSNFSPLHLAFFAQLFLQLMKIPAAAAFGFGQSEVVTHGVEMWMDFQSPAKAHGCFMKLVQR